MQDFYIVVASAFVGAILLGLVVAVADPYQRGMVAVASGQYDCQLEEQADKTTKWVCERVK